MMFVKSMIMSLALAKTSGKDQHEISSGVKPHQQKALLQKNKKFRAQEDPTTTTPKPEGEPGEEAGKEGGANLIGLSAVFGIVLLAVV